MPITIDGDGTITGVSVGGLPDGIVDTDMIAAGAVTQAKRSAATGTDSGLLQIVSADYSTGVSTSSTSFVDSGLSLSITPSSSSNKVLVIVAQTITAPSASSNVFGKFRLRRDSTSIYNDERLDLYGQYSHNTHTISILDSPSTTSSVTYKTQIASENSSYSIEAQHGDLRTSTITLIEVAS